jgi:large conductance mechanosensitive channel
MADMVPFRNNKDEEVFKDFKQFLLRGNVVDLAVAVVIGAAFSSVVTALVKDFVTPLIAAIGGKPDFSKLHFTIHNSIFMYGDFLNQFISFIIVATVIFFLVVQPINHLIQLSKRKEAPADPTTRKCPECLSEIPRLAVRCAFCTAKVEPQKITV